ncbi:PTS sugar transporter subunit IIA [Galbitalea sp. SE-J8]|uniref:PTS sugar transporter subunit IIA n=1 Tax=Galbitalea sp. SE-J8 TaxID=3054952 RepID=UPI00259CFE75|nr:PTS sugar transporter subunit IIA [Galbitalea sp. SE-J8]MDM4762754.1 PTS sugar transporter subunit IIA [Galbitalea sp. SE-J8]
MTANLPPLSPAGIVLGATAVDWRAAVQLAGAALVAVGATLPAYTDAMVRMIEEHGPYVVIAPRLALAHARPGPDVLADGLAIVTLDPAVAFGHPHNDPVSVVLGLAIADPLRHLQAVAALANVFNDSTAIADLAAATSTDEVLTIMGGRA